MGTNYYAIPKMDDDTKEKIILAIKEDRVQEARQMIPPVVHIGKSSLGWQFLFNHNNWEYFDKSLDSMINFLKESTIEDEYGEVISFEEFWQKVESKKHLLDNKEYFTNWDKYNQDIFDETKILPKPHYIAANFHQETHFGLFFSDSTEFS